MDIRIKKLNLENEMSVLQDYYRGIISKEEAFRQIQKFYPNELVDIPDESHISDLSVAVTECNRNLKDLKTKLKRLLVDHDGIRFLREECMNESSVISLFESSLTRTLGMHADVLSDSLIIVRVYFFEVFKNIVLDGFMWRGARYVFLTASAGQIRTKKAVFVKESLYKKYERTIMCGLTIEDINNRGGINTNKFLAYLSLCNSATDNWEGFDIDRTIVVDDMETLVSGVVDFIDDKTYQCTRKQMDVPVKHTDGCGMILDDSTDPKSFMVRLPWIKGLLSPFPFDKFVRQYSEEQGRNVGIIKDIYGLEHDILAENINVIFTKSQFKLWEYYDSWDQYKQLYKQFNCFAGICNVEEDVIRNASINYQMLQTLTDMTDDELCCIAAKTNHSLEHLTTDVGIMLRSLGAVSSNENMDYKQKCLLLYPELLQDPYFRRDLRQLKDSMERNAWAGKLDIYGKYLFLVPDLYAFCEWLFLGDKNPKGLLNDGEVYSSLFATSNKLDCLRSPHLYREHAVRTNVASSSDLSEWFSKRAIYTSCHDLISKILQFDNDGDKSLVCADKTLVTVAERNMEGIVPLYYVMAKAEPSQLNPFAMYTGMTNAYVMGNIGPISNDITKIWNSEKPDLNIIKILCMKNNFVIDAAKTLYTPIPPKEVTKQIRSCVSGKTPWFFQWAKGKEEHNVERYTDTTVNKLQKIVPHRRMRYKKGKMQTFDYHMLMRNPRLVITPDVERIIGQYRSLVRNIRRRKNTDGLVDNYTFMFQTVRKEMLSDNINPPYVVDSIIYGIFNLYNTENKQIFWEAFGDIVYESLKCNIEKESEHSILCPRCYTRYDIVEYEQCPTCGMKKSGMKVVVCEDCGEEFFVRPNIKNKTRCYSCQEIYRKHYKLLHCRYKRELWTR